MNELNFNDLRDTLTVITGGAGVIGRELALGLASVGGRSVILDISKDAADKVAAEVQELTGTPSYGVCADVLSKTSLEAAREEIHARAGSINFLVNGAGGNSPGATTRLEEMIPGDAEFAGTFFDIDTAAMEKVFSLNYFGTILPTMILARDMVTKGHGAIVNISSLSAFHPLTKVPAYSAAKAAVSNFTEWLAVHMAKTGIRVNAIAPGFFLTHQNRFLLLDEASGELTARGNKILAATPAGRFGNPSELAGALAYLLSDISGYVNGTVLVVDGGYNAYSGV